MDVQFLVTFIGAVVGTWVQVTPLLVEVYIYPLAATAASFVPSGDEVIDCQFLFTFIGEDVTSIQFTPKSIDRYTRPPNTTAASFVPSADEVMDLQPLEESRAVQVAPLSVEV